MNCAIYQSLISKHDIRRARAMIAPKRSKRAGFYRCHRGNEAGQAIACTSERIPNDAAPTRHIKIRIAARLFGSGKSLGGRVNDLSLAARQKSRLQFCLRRPRLSKTDRCRILATRFFEYTAPEGNKPKVTLQDQHRFTLKDEEWFGLRAS
jgi:hypothetical protein